MRIKSFPANALCLFDTHVGPAATCVFKSPSHLPDKSSLTNLPFSLFLSLSLLILFYGIFTETSSPESVAPENIFWQRIDDFSSSLRCFPAVVEFHRDLLSTLMML
nr:hypothetical protein Iba_chr12aCG2490 [Ipomoea batatas]GMD65305.1 hypothetical protein Iba_chr12cCG4110 [Ipomoea batatas]